MALTKRKSRQPRPWMNCLRCGKLFLSKLNHLKAYSRFCSNSCCRRHHAPTVEATCIFCGTTFLKGLKNTQRFCNRKCFKEAETHFVALDRYYETLEKSERREMAFEATCARNYQKHLEREALRKRVLLKSSDGSCEWCGNVLEGNRTRFCSDRCNHHHKKLRRRGYEQHGKVDRKAIFDRDGWCCVYCGTVVHEPYDPCSDTSATIDHVIPLAKGGKHVPENCVTSCKRCNTKKSDSVEVSFGR